MSHLPFTCCSLSRAASGDPAGSAPVVQISRAPVWKENGKNMFRALAVLLTLCFANIPILRSASASPSPFGLDQQQGQQQDQQQYQQQDQDQEAPYENFSPDQLDNLLSPIALYPDPLLAQVLVAATFPDQVEEAARYVRE